MKVQNEMSTRISVDAVSAIGSMSAFRNAIQGASSAWRAQETALKNSGNYAEAAKARINGLNQVIDLQKAKVDELRQRQAGLDTSNQKQASQYLQLERQIQSANKQLASYQSQTERARQSAAYYASGLADLQHEMKMGSAVSQSYVSMLRAQGNTAKADRAELKSLETSLSSLERQQTKQRSLLKQVEQQSGKTSDAYRKQEIQLNRTGETIAKTKARMKELNKKLDPPKTGAWDFIRNKVLGVDKAEQKAKDSALNFAGVLKANLMGGWIQQGLSMVVTQTKSIITNGMAAAQAGAAMEARWKNIGVAAGGVKELTKQVGDLKANTNLSAQSVNALQTRFYGMTHSVDQTKTLTKGVASLSDQLKLSSSQTKGFASGLSRIESSGKVTSATLGRLEKQAPGLSAAMAKASGMSQKSFNQLVASGKMTTDQFNQILSKASANYGKNAKAFDNTSSGALHRLQAEWTTTQGKLAKPLLKVSSTGLNELSTALNNKDTQRGLQMLAKGLADAAVDAAKFIGYIAKHQTTVKTFGAAILGVAVAFKTMKTAVMAVDIVKNFAGLADVVKKSELVSNAIKDIGTAVKIATVGFNPWVIAIEAVVVGFTLLYKHSAKFRSFVNGLAKDAQKAGKAIGKWFSSAFSGMGKSHAKAVKEQQKQNAQSKKDWDKHMKTLQKGWDSFWKGFNKTQQKGNQAAGKAWNSLKKTATNSITTLWKDVSSAASKGWSGLEKAAKSGAGKVQSHYEDLKNNTSKTLEKMKNDHPKTFGDMYNVIQNGTKTWKDLVSGHWDKLSGDTQDTAKSMSSAHQDLFSSLYDKLNDLTGGGLDKMKDWWDKTLNGIHDSVVNIGGTIKQKFNDLMDGLIGTFGKLINGIIKGINWILDKVGGDGNLQTINLTAHANGTNGPIAKHEVALLNDAPGENYREMVHKHRTGETFMMPAKRNIVMPLEPGDEVLDGKRTAQMMKTMGAPTPHAGGAIGDFFGGIFDKAKDAAEDATDWVSKALKDVVGFGKSMFSHFISDVMPKSTDAVNSGLKNDLPGFFATRLKDWLKKQLDKLNTDNPPGTGVERWRPIILRAFDALGVEPAGWKVEKLLRQIQTESNGNPDAYQNGYTDVNSGGNEARGLLQFAGSTWAADALPGHKNWHSGYDEILAAINVLEHGGEGGWGNVGNGHGWAYGGLITQHGLYEVGENNDPEMIVPLDPNKRGRAYQLLAQVIGQFRNEDGHPAQSSVDDGQSVQVLTRKFDALLAQNQQLLGLIDKLIGVTDSANNPTARYRRTQRDINMAHAQSLVY